MRVITATILLSLLAGCAPRSQRLVTLALAGDVMLGRDVRRLCRTQGVDYPFAQVAPILRQADLAFCNLESPLTDLSVRFPRVNALVGEAAGAGALGRAGFDVVSLANNHAIDAGRTRSDVAVVSFHWGKEGERAHVRGEIERYRHGLIAYCLGNLVFDEKSYGGNEGMVLTCRVSRRGVEDYSVLPTVVRECQAVTVADGG